MIGTKWNDKGTRSAVGEAPKGTGQQFACREITLAPIMAKAAPARYTANQSFGGNLTKSNNSTHRTPCLLLLGLTTKKKEQASFAYDDFEYINDDVE